MMTEKAKFRVKVARDVLKQLAAKKFKAEYGEYICPVDRMYDIRKFEVGDLRAQIKNQTCAVCAYGGLFASAVLLKNSIDVDAGDYCGIDSEKMANYTGKYFSKRQLRLIEAAFEGTDVNGVGDTTETSKDLAIFTDFTGDLTKFGELVCKAEVFNRGVKSSKRRMERIMENIIKNKGEFVP